MWKRLCVFLNQWHLGISFLTFHYRCSTTLLRQRKWLRSMSHLPLTFWSGLNKPSSFWTIASLLIHWLGSSSSFRHSTLTAQWRNHLSKGRWLAIVIPKGGEMAAAKEHLCSDFHSLSLKSESYFPPCLNPSCRDFSHIRSPLSSVLKTVPVTEDTWDPKGWYRSSVPSPKSAHIFFLTFYFYILEKSHDEARCAGTRL